CCQQETEFLGRPRLHMHSLEPARAHHMSDATGVILVGFVDQTGQRGAKLSHLNANCWQPCSRQLRKKPFRKAASFQSHPLKPHGTVTQRADQNFGFRYYLSLTNDLPCLGEQADSWSHSAKCPIQHKSALPVSRLANQGADPDRDVGISQPDYPI